MNNNKQRKNSFNKNFFENINSSDKAYFLGFILGDGSIHEKQNSLHICLHKKDIDILKKFKRTIRSKVPISPHLKNSIQFSITNKKMISDLKRKNIIKNKSKKNISLPNIKEEYTNDLIRGIFDADGSISRSHKNQILFHITGTKNIIIELNKVIGSILNKKNKISKKKGTDTYVLHYSSKDDLKNIYRYLYIGSDVYLDRKEKKFTKYYCEYL